MRKIARLFQPTVVSLATAFEDQTPSELVIPETFDGMSDADVAALHTQAAEAFNALLEAGKDGDLSAEDIAQLTTLTEGVEALSAEVTLRDEAKAERAEQAAALAARVNGTPAEDEDGTDEGDAGDADEEGDDSEEGEAPAEDADADADEDAGESGDAVTASGAAPKRKRAEVRMPLAAVKRGNKVPAPTAAEGPRQVLVASGDVSGYATDQALDFSDASKAVEASLTGFNKSHYESAAARGRHLQQQTGIMAVKREFGADRTIGFDDSQSRIDKVLSEVADPHRVKDGAGLVAAGGWCAPSETMYDLLEMESRDGLLSIPEVGINRGGIRFTKGPNFSDIYDQFPGFQFTESDDEDGLYQPGAEGNVEGPKPCVHIECPDFEEHRLEVDGLCITAGILMRNAYPEVIDRTIRGALVARAHRTNGLMIQRMVDGSDAVTFPGPVAGTLAPVLEAIELQAEHTRYSHRLARGSVLEAVFPLWVRGAVRADLSRRHSLALFDVTDAQIDQWFRSRGIAPQFVYNWQALTGTPASLTAFPDTLSFLMYPAGTWFRGSSTLITVDTLYDSVLLGQNNYTALFTEEGWMVVKRGFDSRVITVPLAKDGATGQAVALEASGVRAAAGGEG